jgi:HEAT repeat protein
MFAHLKSISISVPQRAVLRAFCCVVALGCSSIAANDIQSTVDRALDDLQQQTSELRRGAVMLLAKYPRHPDSLPAIASALDDPEPSVRRAAIVSLAENIQMLNRPLAERIFGALSDEDPEVRLTASTWLPQLILSLQGFAFSPQQSAVDQLHARSLLNETMAAVFNDPVVQVRRNAVDALRYMRPSPPADLLLRLPSDPDPLVRIAALEVLPGMVPPTSLLNALRPLINDPDPRVRLKLAEVLPQQNIQTVAEALSQMTMDDTEAVRIQAQLALLQMQPARDFPSGLHNAILEGDVPATAVERLLMAFRQLQPQQARDRIELLLDANNASIRTAAAGAWLTTFEQDVPTDALIRLLADPAIQVREATIRHLVSQRVIPSQRLAMALAENPFEDVKRNAFNIFRMAPEEVRSSLALTLMPDPSPLVRQTALAQIIALRPPQWPRVLFGSLRDADRNVRMTAANALRRGMGPEGNAVAARFVEQFPNADVTPLLRSIATPSR